jgi:hypothetical protein
MLGYGYGSSVATQAIATLRERTSTQPTNQDFFRFGQGIVNEKTNWQNTEGLEMAKNLPLALKKRFLRDSYS